MLPCGERTGWRRWGSRRSGVALLLNAPGINVYARGRRGKTAME